MSEAAVVDAELVEQGDEVRIIAFIVDDEAGIDGDEARSPSEAMTVLECPPSLDSLS